MELKNEWIQILNEELEDALTYIGAAQVSQNINYVLKALDDEIKNNGVDWQYDLTPRGAKLQKLYEEIYEANRKDLEK